MNNLTFLDLVTIISFVVGMENLDLNFKQSQQLDKHLSEQDEKLLAKIIEQNEELLRQNIILIRKLEEKKKWLKYLTN